MTHFKSIAVKAGRACYDFNMLKDKDKILVCFSGGKDSFILLKVLLYLKKKYPIDFELKILVINPGFDENFNSQISLLLEEGELEFEVLDTQIREVIEEQSMIKKFRPCFMCSRLRRGIIYDYAMKNGFNKIALGHNLDDAIETHLMNLFYSNKTSFLKPKYLAENGKVEVVRPLIYVDEDDIVSYCDDIGFVAVKNDCPLREEGDSKREYFKKLIDEMKNDNPKIKESAFHAFSNVGELNEWKKKEKK